MVDARSANHRRFSILFGQQFPLSPVAGRLRHRPGERRGGTQKEASPGNQRYCQNRYPRRDKSHRLGSSALVCVLDGLRFSVPCGYFAECGIVLQFHKQVTLAINRYVA
jgi:hypothetical protein